MKAIINGRLYNTETALLLGRCISAQAGVLQSCWEEFYRKKNGEYFVYGEGGPFSKYGHFFDGEWHEGGAITVLSEAEAREWAEQNLDADGYISIFGEVEE